MMLTEARDLAARGETSAGWLLLDWLRDVRSMDMEEAFQRMKAVSTRQVNLTPPQIIEAAIMDEEDGDLISAEGNVLLAAKILSGRGESANA